ncbi:transglycosylase domain-containing protein [Amycolatopsis pigmentata]|uniref:Transglycosylase domain-containing protein n=1 Tax=Amycolatopsis pigmentata TaxID=450801 RepID=A0ABW5G4I0_9PSEU
MAEPRDEPGPEAPDEVPAAYGAEPGEAVRLRRRMVWRRVRRGAYVVLALAFAAPVVAFLIVYASVSVPDPNALVASLNQPVTMYYADGSPLYAKESADTHRLVTWDKIPPAMRNAQMAAEDSSFMTNSGFDAEAIVRTVWNRLGGGTGGGSTIGQEYVKNATGNDESTLKRKFTEMVTSYKMTRTYSKQDILTAYLNTVYFGRGAYGVQAAAQAYFGIDVRNLSIEQAALLAGLVQLPGEADDPAYQNQRFHYVMGQLLANHWISQAQYDSAQFPTPIGARGGPGPTSPTRQYAVSAALAEMAGKGFSEQALSKSGAKIYTTINPPAQAAAEAAVTKIMAADTAYPDEAAALVAVDPVSGGVIAYYGGDGSTAYDLARTPQQPGSSFKPYVLAAGLRGDPAHIGLGTVYDGSDNQTIAGRVVHNSDGEGADRITVSDAMTRSVNTVFYRMAEQAGVGAVRQAAWDAGIPKRITTSLGSAFDSLQQTDPATGKGTGVTELGIALGQYPVRPIDQAQGYATFAANGMYVPVHFVTKVVDGEGKTLYQFAAAPKPAFSPDLATNASIARTVTESLKDVATSSGDGLAGNRPTAAKTGTAQFNDTSHNSQAWMVGYTPQIVTAVWFGNKKQPAPIYGDYHNGRAPEKGYDVYGREEPGYIWQAFMNSYLAGQPVARFSDGPTINGVPPAPAPEPKPEPPRGEPPRPGPPPRPGGGGGRHHGQG